MGKRQLDELRSDGSSPSLPLLFLEVKVIMMNSEKHINVIWNDRELPEDENWKFVKRSKLVSKWKLDIMPRYYIARWHDEQWVDIYGNEVTDVIAWAPLEDGI